MNDNTLLYRQISPEHVQNGRVTSLAFRPMPKDEKKLSVYDGDKLSPEESYNHFVGCKCRSVGVLGVEKQECIEEGLHVLEDYETHPYHVLIDFSGKTNNQVRRAAEHLKEKAITRDWLYWKG